MYAFVYHLQVKDRSTSLRCTFETLDLGTNVTQQSLSVIENVRVITVGSAVATIKSLEGKKPMVGVVSGLKRYVMTQGNNCHLGKQVEFLS